MLINNFLGTFDPNNKTIALSKNANEEPKSGCNMMTRTSMAKIANRRTIAVKELLIFLSFDRARIPACIMSVVNLTISDEAAK
jgi:hypothetical protein